MELTRPLTISILIPTRNRAVYLNQAIESALDQDYPHLEIIVSDNASSDGTQQVVNKYSSDPRFRYYRNEFDIGLVANHKKAIECAAGDFFMVLSDDDYLVDNRYITKASSLIQKHADLVMVYAQGYVLHETSKSKQKLLLPFREVEPGRTIFMSRGTVKPLDFTLCNVLFRRDVAISVRPYENIWNLSSDSELFLLMCLRGNVGIVKDFVSVYRVHSTSITSNIRKDPRLLIHNLEYTLRPYHYAREHNALPENDLRDWEQRLILPEVRSSLLWSALYYRTVCRQLHDELRTKYPDIVDTIFSDLSFRFQYAVAMKSRLAFWIISGPYRRELARERRRMRWSSS